MRLSHSTFCSISASMSGFVMVSSFLVFAVTSSDNNCRKIHFSTDGFALGSFCKKHRSWRNPFVDFCEGQIYFIMGARAWLSVSMIAFAIPVFSYRMVIVKIRIARGVMERAHLHRFHRFLETFGEDSDDTITMMVLMTRRHCYASIRNQAFRPIQNSLKGGFGDHGNLLSIVQ